MPRRPDAELIAVLAARGCGKSSWTNGWLDKRRSTRLAIWDVKREHSRHVAMATADIGEFIRALKARTWRLAFHPDMHDAKRRAAQFDLFCKAVYIAKHCDVVVEELAFVTRPSWAPAGWRTLSLLGRDENPEGGNVTVLGTAQRPASIDKDFVGNATLLHVGRLPYEGDAEKVAKTLGMPKEELMQLPPLHWVERGEHDNSMRRGVISFSGSKGISAPKKKALGRVPKAAKVTAVDL